MLSVETHDRIRFSKFCLKFQKAGVFFLFKKNSSIVHVMYDRSSQGLVRVAVHTAVDR